MNDIQKLRYWTFKILPLVYDDSLSYYEVLAKVTSKLNEVIENVNDIPDAIKEQLDSDSLANKIMQNLAKAIATDEGEATFTATAKDGGELIWLNGVLYEVVVPMAVGTNYVVGSNINEVVLEDILNHMKGYLSDKNEFYAERSTHDYDTGVYLYWKDNLYITTADIKINDILYDGGDRQNLKEVNLGDEISSHYLEMHDADNNLQTQIDENENDIEQKYTTVSTNLANEIQRATTTENNIDSRVNNIVAQSGDSTTEIVDARNINGTTYSTLHEAINAFYTSAVKSFATNLANSGISDLDTITENGIYVSGNSATNYSNIPADYLTAAFYLIVLSGVKIYVDTSVYQYLFIKVANAAWEPFLQFNPNDSIDIRNVSQYYNHLVTLEKQLNVQLLSLSNKSHTHNIGTDNDLNGYIGYDSALRRINDFATKGTTLATLGYTDLYEVPDGVYVSGNTLASYSNAPSEIPDNAGFVLWANTYNTDIRLIFSTNYPMIGFNFNKTGWQVTKTFTNEIEYQNAFIATNYVAIGDSITQGAYSYLDGSGEPASAINRTDTWAYMLANKMNMQLNNLAQGGYTWARTKTDILTDDLNISSAELVTVMLGTNDYASSQYHLGTVNDEIEADTIAGQVKWCLQTIMTKAPRASIVVILPINSCKVGTQDDGYAYNATNADGWSMKDLSALIKSCADLYLIPTINLTSECESINNLNITECLLDGLHPTLECHKRLARELMHKI